MRVENVRRSFREINGRNVGSRRILLTGVAVALGKPWLAPAPVALAKLDASQFCKRCDKHTQCNGDTDYCLKGYCVASGATCNGAFYDFSCETVQRKKSRRWFLCKRNGAFCCNRNGKHCKRAQRLCF